VNHQKELTMNRFLSFLAGVFSGALVGATIAILLAPASGEELRIQIQERAAYIQDEVKNAATERRAELEEQLAALKAPKPPTEPV
jgi:gas vesicle protein